jgi:hypothetical protein
MVSVALQNVIEASYSPARAGQGMRYLLQFHNTGRGHGQGSQLLLVCNRLKNMEKPFALDG